jgi:hypothetical protein
MPADCSTMTKVDAIGAASSQSSQAIQAATANAEAGNAAQTKAQADLAKLGLPPVSLSTAASTNTLNAALVSSQWGIDPASVGGVYGGAAASGGGLFSGDNLLPLLQSLSPKNAEQALALIGISAPTQGSGKAAAAVAAAGGMPTTTAQAISPTGQAALDQASAGSGPMVVDPLWGRSA